MSDRSLLEDAAKAAGYEISFNGDYCPKWKPSAKTGRIFWNPLTDDGDALRLAVKLGIEIKIIHPRDHVELGRSCAGAMWNLHNDDPCAATRRAIVRAAAELGRAAADISTGREE